MTRAILFIVILCFTSKTFGKTFSECELVIELRKQGFPEDQMKDWLCLIYGESSRRTSVVGGPDEDGSHDYGLFQINDRYWCNSENKPGKACNVRCKDLLLDDISLASRCAKKIFSIHGFSAWVAWNNECKGKSPPKINC